MSQKHPAPVTPAKGSSAAIIPYGGPSSKPFFCTRSGSEIEAIDALIKYIKKPMVSAKDRQWGTVYAIQARGTDMTKLGYTHRKEVVRVEEHIRDCGIQFQRMYQHPGFQGALRSEQIVLKLLKSFNFEMYNCACGVGCHTEWFSKPFLDIITTVQLVCNWMQYQTPYQPSGELRKEWKESLDQWYGTQRTTSPLEWTVFFLRHTLYWRDYPIHLSLHQRVKQELVYSPGPSKPKCHSSERHRPTGYFELTPVENREHNETYQKKLEIETVKDPSGKSVSKIKKEETFHLQDRHTIGNTASDATDGNVFDAKTPDRQDSKGSEADNSSESSEQDSVEVQSHTDDETYDPEQDFDSDTGNGDSSADDIPPNDYGSPVPYPKHPRRGNRGGSGNGNGKGKGGGQGAGNGIERRYRAPRPQDDVPGNASGSEVALSNEGADFIAPKLLRRTTMTDDVKAGASKVIGKVKRAGRHLRDLPSVKPKKK